MIGRTIAELRIGDSAELSRRVDQTRIEEFVEAVGDLNPIHSDPEFAVATSFREPIAPGVFTAGMISAVIGTQLPGPGSIYVSQTLRFLKPVKPGDTITARVEVVEMIPDRNRVRLATVCRNQRDEEVLVGEAWVLPPRTSVSYEREPSETVRPALAFLQPWLWTTQALALWGTLGLSLLAAGLQRPPTSASRR
jgi:acyl dehydratase